MNRNDIKRTINILNNPQLEVPTRKRGRPITQTKAIASSSQVGTKEGETRATFIVNESILAKVKAIAYWERLDIKSVVNEALQDAVLKYQKVNRPIELIPLKKPTNIS